MCVHVYVHVCKDRTEPIIKFNCCCYDTAGHYQLTVICIINNILIDSIHKIPRKYAWIKFVWFHRNFE